MWILFNTGLINLNQACRIDIDHRVDHFELRITLITPFNKEGELDEESEYFYYEGYGNKPDLAYEACVKRFDEIREILTKK